MRWPAGRVWSAARRSRRPRPAGRRRSTTRSCPVRRGTRSRRPPSSRSAPVGRRPARAVMDSVEPPRSASRARRLGPKPLLRNRSATASRSAGVGSSTTSRRPGCNAATSACAGPVSRLTVVTSWAGQPSRAHASDSEDGAGCVRTASAPRALARVAATPCQEGSPLARTTGPRSRCRSTSSSSPGSNGRGKGIVTASRSVREQRELALAAQHDPGGEQCSARALAQLGPTAAADADNLDDVTHERRRYRLPDRRTAPRRSSRFALRSSGGRQTEVERPEPRAARRRGGARCRRARPDVDRAA